MISVELRDVAKSFNRRSVFAGVSVTVEQGTALAVTGANGSGKSTLLRIICGLLRPTRGAVLFTADGKTGSAAELRHLIGLVAPDVSLYGDLTAIENLSFFARVRGQRLPLGACEALLDRVGLAGRGNDQVRTYSSGMRHRLKYACALLHQPAVLVLDEPSTNLDEAGICLVRDIMAEQVQRGVLIFATNDRQEAALANAVLPLGQPAGR